MWRLVLSRRSPMRGCQNETPVSSESVLGNERPRLAWQLAHLFSNTGAAAWVVGQSVSVLTMLFSA